nr:3960_t:CDS:2 [Entrophospora candida]
MLFFLSTLAISTFLNVVSLAEIEHFPKRLCIVPDKTKFLCENLIQPFDTLPTHAGQLLDLINAPLLAKLPVASYSDLGKFRKLGDYIYYDEMDSDSELASMISHALSETEITNIVTELEMVTSVDLLTKRPLQLFCNNSDFRIEFSRNATEKKYTTNAKSTPATTKNARPDLLGYINDVLVIKNEEKAARNKFDTAKEELISKFSKLDPLYFGNIKFLICYAVAKDIFCFFAIDGPSKMLVPLSTQLYMDDLNARFTTLRIIINIARIFKTMTTKDAFPAKVIPLGKPLQLRHSTITFFEGYVQKIVLDSELYGIEEDDCVDTLKHMYELAKGHYGLVQVLEGPIFRKGRRRPGKYIIKLKTRGLECPPKDEQTTQVMTCSLLTGLKRLHQCGYVHRDIRLSNIVYDSNNSKGYEYVLIDFEYGGKANEKFDILLTDWDDGTCDEDNVYTTLSDMYQLGRLLEGLNMMFSNDGQDFINKLKKKVLEADAALQHPWIASI